MIEAPLIVSNSCQIRLINPLMRLCAHWSWCFNPGLRQIQRHRAAPKPRCLGDFESWSSSLWVLYKGSQWSVTTPYKGGQCSTGLGMKHFQTNLQRCFASCWYQQPSLILLNCACNFGSHNSIRVVPKAAAIFAIWQVAAVQRQYQRDAVDFFFNNAEKVPPVHSGSENMPNFL